MNSRSMESARRALEIEPMDGPLLMLFGRIQARLGDWEEACEALDGAERLGAPAERIVPHLAELAFLRRDFAATRRLLSRGAGLRQVRAMRPILRFWLENKP